MIWTIAWTHSAGPGILAVRMNKFIRRVGFWFPQLINLLHGWVALITCLSENMCMRQQVLRQVAGTSMFQSLVCLGQPNQGSTVRVFLHCICVLIFHWYCYHWCTKNGGVQLHCGEELLLWRFQEDRCQGPCGAQAGGGGRGGRRWRGLFSLFDGFVESPVRYFSN